MAKKLTYAQAEALAFEFINLHTEYTCDTDFTCETETAFQFLLTSEDGTDRTLIVDDDPELSNTGIDHVWLGA